MLRCRNGPSYVCGQGKGLSDPIEGNRPVFLAGWTLTDKSSDVPDHMFPGFFVATHGTERGINSMVATHAAVVFRNSCAYVENLGFIDLTYSTTQNVHLYTECSKSYIVYVKIIKNLNQTDYQQVPQTSYEQLVIAHRCVKKPKVACTIGPE
jgi:hypothetical protein